MKKAFSALALVTACFFSLLHAGSEDTNRFGADLLFTGLTYHPGGGDFKYPRRLDPGSYWVLLLGGQADFDWYFDRYALLRGSVALNKDCENLWGGFFHLGPRLNLPMGPRFVFRIGIGPTWVWRQNWYGRVAGYTEDSFYGQGVPGDYQSRFIWYGGDVDLEWKIRRDVSLVYSNIPGWPHTITSSLGARYSW